MAEHFKVFLRSIMACAILILSLTGCHKNNESSLLPTDPNLLVVERETEYFDWDASIIVDVPVSGPKHLQDSIKTLMENTLRNWLNVVSDIDDTQTFDSIWKDCQHRFMGWENLDFYREVYQNFIKDDPLQFSFILIGQTESFVTYGIERYHLRSGDNCIAPFSSFENFTFRKKDGKRLENIISWDAIRKIINDNPDVKHPFEQSQLEDEELYAEFFDVGLTEDGLLLVNELVGKEQNEYKLGFIPYNIALPYLSEEAQELVKTMGNNKKYGRDDWYIGKCIGSCGDINLMQREPLWQVFADFKCSDDKTFAADQTYSLTALKKSNHQFIPQSVFNLKNCFMSKYQQKWAKDTRKALSNGKKYSSRLVFESTADWNEFAFGADCFIYDESTGILYVPYQKEATSVDFIPFKFDGKLFNIIRPEKTQIHENKLGTITLDNGKSIFLQENENSVNAYYVINDLFIPAKIFPYYENSVGDVPGVEPLLTSNPSQSFTAFDSTNNTVYISDAEHITMGGYGCFDRYHVYRFNGKTFGYEGENAGFWLHPSLRQYGSLIAIGKSKDYLVRIDELRSYNWREIGEEAYFDGINNDTCRTRIAIWKGKDNMLDKPDMVFNGCDTLTGKGYEYDIDLIVEDDNEEVIILNVYNNGKLTTKQQLKEIANIVHRDRP